MILQQKWNFILGAISSYSNDNEAGFFIELSTKVITAKLLLFWDGMRWFDFILKLLVSFSVILFIKLIQG